MLIPLLLTLSACELAEPTSVMGNFEVSYADNMRVYINDELVAEVFPGEEETIEYEGGTFQVSQLCGEDGRECPSESFWRTVAVDQPQGDQSMILNFVNLDMERGIPGQRMGGLMEDDRSFVMLAGLDGGSNELCAALAVGTVTGRFSDDAGAISEGIITYSWAGGCTIGDGVGVSLRLETDYSAVRTGDYDISSVEAEPPIDEEGEELPTEEDTEAL